MLDSIEWLQKIRKARDVVRKISDRSKVVPEVRSLDQYNDLFVKLKREELSRGRTKFADAMKLGLVELDKIRSRQIRINIDYVNELLKIVPKPDDIDGTVRFCLPAKDQIQKISPKVEVDVNALSITLVSDDPRIQYLRPVQEQDNFGLYAGFRYGNISHLVHVVNHKGTLILKNGYHRAFALLRAGHTFLPCILTDSTEALEQKQGFPPSLIMSEKSPLISDFNTDAAILVPRRKNRFKVTIRAEVEREPSK